MKKAALLTVAVLLGVIGFVFRPTPEAPVQIKQPSKPNVVTQQEPEPTVPAFDQQQWQQQQDQLMNLSQQHWMVYLADANPQPMNDAPSFLEAYRDYRFYGDCLTMIGNVLAGSDPYDYVIPRGKTLDGLPIPQQQALAERLDRCTSLSDFSDGVYYVERARLQLQTRYQNTAPKTAVEQRLAAVLSLLQETEYAINQWRNLQRGEHVDINLYFELNDLRNDLQRQMPQALSLFGGYHESDQAKVDHIKQQLADVERRIEQNKSFDTARINEIEAQLMNLINQIKSEIQTNPSSDALLALYDFYQADHPKHLTQELRLSFTQGFDLIPARYESFLLPVVVHLKACEMGHPCGLADQLTRSLCLDFTAAQGVHACETPLLDYYLQHYLSPNQLLDVDNVLAEWN